MRFALPLALLLAASGCATGPARRSNWQSPLHQDHPLVGQVWDVRRQQFVSMDALEAKARDAHLLLLGETHDNPDHHLLQADLVRAAASSGCMCSFTSGRGSSPSVELIVRSLEGEMSVSGYSGVAGSGWKP